MKNLFFVYIVFLCLLCPLSAGIILVNPSHPNSNDNNPGTDDKPIRTISRSVELAQPGDIVRIHTGVYREKIVLSKSGLVDKPIVFSAADGANVVVTGADLITDWRKENSPEGENVYSTSWPYRFITWSKTGTHPSDDYHKVIGRAEQVFINGYPLHQVLSIDKLTRGTFYVDLENKRLYAQALNNSPLDKKMDRVEASVRSTLWDVRGDYIHTRGLIFRYAATQAQQAMVSLAGRGDVIEDCILEYSNSNGATFRNVDQVARRCVFKDNGQNGFTAGGAHNLLITECLVYNNNTKNFDRGWDCGGCKIVLSRNVVIERSRFLNNRANGIWFDIGNESATVRNCLIADNEHSGIFYEISYGLYAHDNVIIGNGFLSDKGAWGANGGISISSSPGCVIERNLIVGNREGFQFREQTRKTPRIGSARNAPEQWIWNHNETIRNNLFAFNRDAQVWGWFDINDERHLPAKLQKKSATPADKPQSDIAENYKAKTDDGAPAGLSLEKLNIKFENNIYAVHPAQGLFNWGVLWKPHKKYKSLEQARNELNLESGFELKELKFANPAARDFRLPKDSPVIKSGCYPRGTVPEVTLGIMD